MIELLRRPIPRATLQWELFKLLQRGNLPAHEVKIVFPRSLDRENLRDPRRFAQVDLGSRPVRFEFSKRILNLPLPYRLGLLAHEVGHVLMGREGSEDDADLAAAQVLGINIGYDRVNFPGKGLQVAVDFLR